MILSLVRCSPNSSGIIGEDWQKEVAKSFENRLLIIMASVFWRKKHLFYNVIGLPPTFNSFTSMKS